MTYEYVAVEANVGGFGKVEEKLTERINSVAKHGWRMVGVVPTDSARNYLVFEREVADE